MLLGLSMLTVFFVKANALPSKISALGIELQSLDQRAFLYVMSAVLLYFIVAFFLYAMSDFIVWRGAVTSEYLVQYGRNIDARDRYPQSNYDIELDAEETSVYRKNRIWRSLTKPMSVSRAIFEFLLPILVGCYSIFITIQLALKHT